MAFRVDVRVDADGDARDASEPRGDRLEPRQLARRLDVDGLQPEGDGAFELLGRLADAGEDDLRRLESGAPRDFDLPDRVGVDGAAELAQQARDRERRVRLQRVMQRVRIAGERLVDLAVAIAERARAVDVERRPFGGGDGGQRDAVADQVVRISEGLAVEAGWAERWAT